MRVTRVSVVGGTEDSDEAALVARAQVDPRAFAPLYDRYFDAVHRYCLRCLRDREAAADATGQIFLKAVAALPRYRAGSFRAWLFAIAHNEIVDATRRRRPQADLAEADALAALEPTPEEAVLLAEERRSVTALLDRLTPEQRRVVELRMAGLTGQEIADALGQSLAAVKASQFRAYARLRRLLEAGSEDHDARR